MKYEIWVKLAASKGIMETRKIEVEATGPADALVQAALKLDAEGQDRWSLDRVVPVKVS